MTDKSIKQFIFQTGQFGETISKYSKDDLSALIISVFSLALLDSLALLVLLPFESESELSFMRIERFQLQTPKK